MYSVLVLMSTYNGESYLEEQIDSILSQEGVEVHILIRDDGSVDNTCNILDDYAERHSNIKVIKAENVGFVKSFSVLVKMASINEKPFDYYAFSDQDDVWFSNKLLKACSKLSLLNEGIPNLFTSNSKLLYSDGRNQELFHPVLPIFTRGNALVFATEQGCSMTFNRKALDVYKAHEPIISYHDRWMYLICLYLGTVSYEHAPLFYYRIHGNNTLAKERNLIDKLLFYFSNSKSTNHVETAKEFYSVFQSFLTKEDKHLFDIYISYRNNIRCKYILMTNPIFSPPFPYRHFVRKILLNKL